MDVNNIIELVSIGFSAIALLVASIKKRKVKEFTPEELAEKVKAKTKKYYEKQCNKNGLTIDERKEN